MKSILALIILFCIGAILIWALAKGRKESSEEGESERPIKAPSRVSFQNNESVITIDKATQIKSGIVTEPLKPASHMEEIRAYGIVLELRDIITFRNDYIAAKTQLAKSQAALDASRREYERLKALYEDNQNTSAKDFQAAEAAFREDEANARADKAALNALEDTVRQQWGDVLAKWMFQASPSYNRFLKSQDVLIQVTVPKDIQLESAPPTALIQTQDKKIISARFVSQSPHTDPRIQGKSFFYAAPAHGNDILPGMNVLAYMSVGQETRGVILPASSIVWWQGNAWVYVQKEHEHFIRKEVPTDNPVEGGWFVVNIFLPQDFIVVQGAQLLLSEEFRAQIHVGEE